MSQPVNNYPKLHNAAWPGVVGKGPDTPEPFISLDTMIEMTAAAEVGGVRFDGVDLFICAPHVDIDSTDRDLEALAAKLRARNLVAGSLVAPVWPPAGVGELLIRTSVLGGVGDRPVWVRRSATHPDAIE